MVIDRAAKFGVLSVNIKIDLKIGTIFAYVSIFLCVVKKNGKIGKNQKNRDRIKFGIHFPSKRDTCDRMNQITLHYKRNLQNIPLLLFFSR